MPVQIFYLYIYDSVRVRVFADIPQDDGGTPRAVGEFYGESGWDESKVCLG